MADDTTTVRTVDQLIIDGLHPIENEAENETENDEIQGFDGNEDDVPSVESLNESHAENFSGDDQDEAEDDAAVENEDGDPVNEADGKMSASSEPKTGADAWNGDTFAHMSNMDSDTRKRTIMRELEECAPEIVRKYGLTVTSSTLQTLEYELEQFHTKQQLNTQVKFLELGLMAVCYGIEFLNRRVLQGFLALNGWGDNTSKSLGQFRSCLRRIAIRYFTTRRKRSEIMELGMLLLGHMAWYHFQNSSRPVWERVNRRRNRKKRSEKSAGDSKEQKTSDLNGDDDEHSASSSDDESLDEDLEAAPSATVPEKPGVNLLELLSQLV